MKKFKNGFTLIELLVVVLIIGILSAVGLAQYTKVVDKVRYHQFMNVVDSVAKAQEVYYLANGSYADAFEKLDIALPASFAPYTTAVGQECWRDNNNKKNVVLCVSTSFTYVEPWGNATIQYYRSYSKSSKPNKRVCNVNKASTQKNRWTRLCQSMGTATTETFFGGQPAWILF